MNDIDRLRFPVGGFAPVAHLDAAQRRRLIGDIAGLPAALTAATRGLSDAQLATPYREGGWSLRQVVHHLADAHLNGFVRVKLALTEDSPAIKTYEEALWAETADGRAAPVELSLRLLDALHARWVMLLDSLEEPMFARAFSHPDRGRMTLDKAIQLYAWHGVHHTAHITGARARFGQSFAGAP